MSTFEQGFADGELRAFKDRDAGIDREPACEAKTPYAEGWRAGYTARHASWRHQDHAVGDKNDGRYRGGVNRSGLTRQEREDAERQISKLTDRQLDCLVLTAKGCTAKGVGAALGIDYKTAEKHLVRVRSVLGVDTTVEAAVMATKAGLV